MARRRAEPVEDVEEEEQQEQVEEEGETVKLQFNEPLSWRPGKPIPTDQLLKRLDRLSKELAEMDQETVDVNSLVKVSQELASHQLLTHKDKGVRAYTACCVVDILRLCAPNAPLKASQLKDIFSLCVNSIIPALFDPANSYNNQHKYVLISLVEVRSIVLLSELDGSDPLLLQLFSTIFDGVSGSKSKEKISKDVEFNMQELLGALVDEVASLPPKVVDVIMAQFLRAAAPGDRHGHDHAPVDENQATLLSKEEPEAYQIAKNLCHMYPEKMSRFASQYFSDVIMEATSFAGKGNGHKDGDSDDEDGPGGPSQADLRELRKAHRLVTEIWRAAPMILQNVVPQLDAELAADNVELRHLATETLGHMISGIGAAGPPPPPTLDASAYPPLRLDSEPADDKVTNVLTTPLSTQSFSQTHPVVYNNFMSRKNDKAATIRAAWTIAVGYILSTSAGGIGLSREEESVLVQGLSEKLNDSDEKVRLAAVTAIESFKFRDVILQLALNGGVSRDGSVLSNLADRCRDKRPLVRVQAMTLLANLWGVGTGELLAGNEVVSAALSAIPSRIFNVFYANDPDLNALLDVVIFEKLVPLSFPPPPKKSAKGANGASSQSQSAVSSGFDPDAIRAERILLLATSLDPAAKKAFFALQARQPQFAKIVDTFIKQCQLFNGGVMDDNAEKKTSNLNKTISYISQFLADPHRTKADLLKFAKANDRRNYNLIGYVIGQEHDFKTAYKALKELTKRIQTSKEPSVFDTLLPLLYRSGCFMFNRSHLPTFMDYSKSDKDGLGSIALEVLNEISQRNPELFKAHIGDLCKDLVDQAPTATNANDAAVVDSLKACASYSRKYPKEIPMDRSFIQTMSSYALYGQPPRAAKYAVHVLLSKKDAKSDSSAADLLQKTLKDWKYGGPFFLNKLYTLSQLELLAPKATEAADATILDICVQQLLREVRTDAKDSDPKWVDDADLDDECKAKCLALKILVNRLRSMEDAESAQSSTKAVWKLLRTLISKRGEMCKTKDTPNHHKSRLRLVAAKLILKLCTQKQIDDQVAPADFDTLAWITQDDVAEVRHAFIGKLQKYLAEGKLKPRYYTIVFLTAFEPKTDFKHRVETWIRSRARHFQEAKQSVLEAIMPRLLSLLAHHPDYSQDLDDLVDHARYLVFYISMVATEANLGLIYKYAERVKQTKDAVYPEWENHRVLSDLAQAVIRKWQERKNWTFEAYPGKIGLPMGLYVALDSHDEAQEVAEKQYIPDGIDEKLDELLRAIDRKKKRKSVDDQVAQPPAKRAKPAPKSSSAKEPKEAKAPRPAARKIAAPRPKKTPSRPKKEPKASPVLNDSERRRSGRSRKSEVKYVERADDEDEEEMLEGVAEWEYEGGDKSKGGESDEEEEGSGSELSEVESVRSAGTPVPAPKDKKKKAEAPRRPAAAAAAAQAADDSDLSELDSEEIEVDKEDDEMEEATPPPPPTKATGRKTSARGAASKAPPRAAAKAKSSPRNGKAAAAAAAAAAPAPGKSTRLTRRTKAAAKSDEFTMDESD